jgi:hypothetical protein
MSEPNAGSDLASVGTRATPTQIATGGWRLNGRKIWTTNAHHCHYMIALVRSSGSPKTATRACRSSSSTSSIARRHGPPDRRPDGRRPFQRGLLRRRAAGRRRAGRREGDGWMQVNAELAFERSGPERIYSSIVLLEHWLQVPAPRRDAAPCGGARAAGRRIWPRCGACRWRSRRGSPPARARCRGRAVKDLGTELEQMRFRQ